MNIKTTLKISPGYANAHNNLGNAYIIQNKIDDAINAYQAALKLKPDLIQARQNLDLLLKK